MRTKPLRWFFTLAVMLGCGTSTRTNAPNYPTKPIELKYYAVGHWAVTTSLVGACCDSSGNKFDLYYPSNLGADGFKHPIITWGNGTHAKSWQYAYFLNHLASWGFVIIATEDENTGPGQTILDGANYMVSANSNSSSIFYQKLEVTEIGAMGHSQGATGAINALIKSRISPPTQYSWESGEQSIQAYYDAVPSGPARVKGTIVGPDHLDLIGQPACSTDWTQRLLFMCTGGVYGYLGYSTAWMMAQLQGDKYAAGAFVKSGGEIFSETTNWEYVESNIP